MPGRGACASGGTNVVSHCGKYGGREKLDLLSAKNVFGFDGGLTLEIARTICQSELDQRVEAWFAACFSILVSLQASSQRHHVPHNSLTV
jgi:hypothetical protein